MIMCDVEQAFVIINCLVDGKYGVVFSCLKLFCMHYNLIAEEKQIHPQQIHK